MNFQQNIPFNLDPSNAIYCIQILLVFIKTKGLQEFRVEFSHFSEESGELYHKILCHVTFGHVIIHNAK